MISSSNLNKIIEIIKLIRPEFYNKLTWLVVGAGVAITSSPVWQDILVTTLKHFWPKIYGALPSGDPPLKLGIILIAMGLIYHFITASLLRFLNDQKNQMRFQEEREHDEKIYRDWDNILNEILITNSISELECSHAIWSSQLDAINSLAYHTDSIGTQYINREIVEKSSAFTSILNDLRIFISTDFDLYPHNQDMRQRYRLHLHPEWNQDFGGDFSEEQDRRYQEKSDELRRLTNDLRNKYDDYRQVIKNILLI